MAFIISSSIFSKLLLASVPILIGETRKKGRVVSNLQTPLVCVGIYSTLSSLTQIDEYGDY